MTNDLTQLIREYRLLVMSHYRYLQCLKQKIITITDKRQRYGSDRTAYECEVKLIALRETICDNEEHMEINFTKLNSYHDNYLDRPFLTEEAFALYKDVSQLRAQVELICSYVREAEKLEEEYLHIVIKDELQQKWIKWVGIAFIAGLSIGLLF